MPNLVLLPPLLPSPPPPTSPQVLRLSDNRISGGLEQLAVSNLVNLRSLDLAGNAGLKTLSQLEPLKQLPQLKKLALDGCPVKV